MAADAVEETKTEETVTEEKAQELVDSGEATPGPEVPASDAGDSGKPASESAAEG